MSTNRNQDISALILDLQDPNDNVRSSAADALGNLGAEAKDAIPALIVVVQQEQDYWVRNRAIVALGNMGEAAKEAIPALIEAFKADDAINPPDAATALGKIGKAAIPSLKVALRDLDSKVRDYAARSLGEIGADAIPTLAAALLDSNPEVSQLAAEALGNIGSAAVPALITALKDPNPEVRHLAAIALRAMKSAAKTAIPNLVALLKDSDEKVHRIAAEALGEIGAEAIPVLIQAFEERAIRRDVVYALGRIKPTNQDVIDFLTKITNDESNDLEVRWMAAVGLDRNGVDMETFFVNHNLPSPSEESIKCLDNHKNWDSPGDTARKRVVYAFDVYTGQCVLIGYVGGRYHAQPVNIYEQAVQMIREYLGKN